MAFTGAIPGSATMATRVGLALAVLALVFAVDSAASQETNTLIVYEGPGCTGTSVNVMGDGCTTLPFHGGYKFIHEAACTGVFFPTDDCTGPEFEAVDEYCHQFYYNSFKMDCGDAVAAAAQ